MPIRETYWNIPHWAEIAQYLLALLTFIILSYGVIRRVQRWRQGFPERRTDNIGTRLWSVIVQAVGQLRTLQDIYPGIMHCTLKIRWVTSQSIVARMVPMNSAIMPQ